MSTVRTVAKNTTALFVAEILSQAFRIIYFSILVRYIQAEGVGKISTATALVSALFVVLSFGFEQLIIRDVAADKAKAAGYLNNILFMKLILTLFFAGSLWVAVQLFGYSREMIAIAVLYAIAYMIKEFSDVGLAFFRAFETMEYNLIVRIARDTVNIALSLVLIYLHYSLIVIVSTGVLANLVELALTFVLLRKRGIPVAPRLKVDLRLCGRLAVAVLPFAIMCIYPLAQSQLQTLILSVERSVSDVGWFSSANTPLTMIMLVPALFMRAMYPVFSRFSGKSITSLKIAYQKSFIYLLILGLAISIGTFLTADKLIYLLFGPGFEQSVPLLRVLAWQPLAGFVGYVNGNYLLAIGKEKLYTVTEGIFAGLFALLAFVLVPRFGAIGACYAIVIPTAVGFVFYSILCHAMLRLEFPWKRSLATGLAGLVMAVCVYAALRVGIHFFAVVLLVAPPVYGGALYTLRVVSNEDISLFKQALKPR